MESRDRVVATLNHREPNRIPNDFGGTIVSSIHIDAYRELADYLKINIPEPGILDQVQQLPVIDKEVREYLKADLVQLSSNPPDTWKLDIEEKDDCYTYIDQWGTTMRMPKKGGKYFDFWEFPVGGDLNDLKNYDWPDPDDPGRTKDLREEAIRIYENTDYAICGSPLIGGGTLEQAERIIGLESFLSLFVKDPEAADYALSKICEIYQQATINFLSEVGDLVQVVLYWDDIGAQDSLLISPRMYRKMLKPKQKKLFRTIKDNTDAKLFFHTDGAIRPLIPDLIEIGVDILQPVQVSSKGMGNTKELKKKFGDDLVFWGASCDTQAVLPYGTPDEVREATKRRILDLKPRGGYVFAPIHNIQPDVPPENIMAMYETFFEYRNY